MTPVKIVLLALGVAGVAAVSIVATVAVMSMGDGTQGSGSGGNPANVVRKYYERLAAFDTAGMTELVCPEEQDDFQSGVGLLQGLFGFASFNRIGSEKLTLEDFSVDTVYETEQAAIVEVVGRLNAGPPLGSTDISDEQNLKKEAGRWCMTDEKVVRELEPGEPKATGAEQLAKAVLTAIQANDREELDSLVLPRQRQLHERYPWNYSPDNLTGCDIESAKYAVRPSTQFVGSFNVDVEFPRPCGGPTGTTRCHLVSAEEDGNFYLAVQTSISCGNLAAPVYD